jgi:hypothetical protein
MNRTVHKKLTEKSNYSPASSINKVYEDNMLTGLRKEMDLLQAAARDLLSPRQEAITAILQKARAL